MDEGVRGATAADVAGLTHSLALAFEEDPIFAWLLPDKRRRYGKLRRFFALEVGDIVLPAGSAWITPEGSGACLELPPGAWRMPLGTQALHAPQFIAREDPRTSRRGRPPHLPRGHLGAERRPLRAPRLRAPGRLHGPRQPAAVADAAPPFVAAAFSPDNRGMRAV